MEKIVINESGLRVFNCLHCLDTGWVHPVNQHDGKPDWGRVNPCPHCNNRPERKAELSDEAESREQRTRAKRKR